MDDHALAAIYARAFPDSATPWGAASFANFRADPLVRMDTHQNGALITRIVAREAEILSLFVDPPYQNQGIAKALLCAFFDDCIKQDTDSIFLEVAKDNLAAIALYDDQGFVTTATRPGYYPQSDGSRTDALIMRKAFK